MNWVRCEERQPDKSGSYLITYEDKDLLGNVEYSCDICSFYTEDSDEEHDEFSGWQTVAKVVAWNDEEIVPFYEQTGTQTIVVTIENVPNNTIESSKFNNIIIEAIEREGYTAGIPSSTWEAVH